MDFYIDITSEIRKITRGSTSPLAEFVTHEDQKLEKILNLIIALNSGDQKLTMNDLKPIDVVATSDFEVPHAKFVFPVVSSNVEMDLKYFTKA
ncbi:hypothetical protein P692DRAFT_20755020 [Suillus brevipes Sb2]|nr:hypothetical protein P692DRAFT_20755020 [Suillus brevipes Sb2]